MDDTKVTDTGDFNADVYMESVFSPIYNRFRNALEKAHLAGQNDACTKRYERLEGTRKSIREQCRDTKEYADMTLQEIAEAIEEGVEAFDEDLVSKKRNIKSIKRQAKRTRSARRRASAATVGCGIGHYGSKFGRALKTAYYTIKRW